MQVTQDGERSKPDAQAEAVNWAREMRSLLGAALRLAEYFGTEDEELSLRAALAPAWYWIGVVEGGAESSPEPTYADFKCERELAAILTPVLQVVVEPVPSFVGLAAGLPEAERKKLVVPFGVFSGTMARHVCTHIWQEFRDLAPEGWLL